MTTCIVLAGGILVENIDKRLPLRFVICLDPSAEKSEVKTMKTTSKHLSRSAQSWINRVLKRHQPAEDYHSELRDWVRHVILEAEKNENFKKKERFLSLLKDLDAA